jgi:hypothetical protein
MSQPVKPPKKSAIDQILTPLTPEERKDLGCLIEHMSPAAMVLFARYEAALTASEAKSKRLYEDLIKHGRHFKECPQYGRFAPNGCTCGLRSAIAINRDD